MLGSTGSIGRSALDVLRRQRDHFAVVALTCGRNREEFERQVAEWRPAFAGLAGAGADDRWPCGPEVLIEAATHPDVDIVVNAVVGRRRARRHARRAAGRQAGGAGEQGEPGHGGRPRGPGGLRRRRRAGPGGLGAQRGAPVRRGSRRGAGPADPHLLRRARSGNGRRSGFAAPPWRRRCAIRPGAWVRRSRWTAPPWPTRRSR